MRTSLRVAAAALCAASALTLTGALPQAGIAATSNAGAAQRVLDTRSGVGAAHPGPVDPGQVIHFDVPAVRSAGASTVVLNVTATGADAAGWLRVWSCADAQPPTSSVNFAPGRDTANAVVVAVDDAGICLSSQQRTHVIADVTGWFSGSDDLVATTPNRLLDTRQTGRPLRAGQELAIEVAGTRGVPADARSVALNLTVDAAAQTGWLVAYPCGTSTPSSTLNFAAGDTAAALTVTGVGGRNVCVRSSVDVQLIVDVSAWSRGTGQLRTASPRRLLDTRNPTQWPSGAAQHEQTLYLRVAGRGGVPTDARAALLTVTVADSASGGYVTVWPCDQRMPATSTINTWPGALRSNMALTGIAADGTVCLRQFSNGGTPLTLVVDAVGYVTGGPRRGAATSAGGVTRPVDVPTAGTFADVASNFSAAPWLVTGEPVPERSGDVSGSFRTFCGFSHLSHDDPIVYPNEAGASHLHMYFGNTGADAYSTYRSLRTTGSSTCQGGPLNRTGYWIPAMLDGAGKVVVPQYMELYYKGNGTRDMISDIRTNPNGLRMVAGFDMNDMHNSSTVLAEWSCNGGRKSTTIPNCPRGQDLLVEVRFPMCWNGVALDSADHRSHMAYGTGGGGWVTREGGCPASHPIHLPELTERVAYTSDGNTSSWHVSSDRMPGMAAHPNGSTFHADWFGAWDNEIQETWTQECIREMRNCVWGELGTGTRLLDYDGTYDGPARISPPSD